MGDGVGVACDARSQPPTRATRLLRENPLVLRGELMGTFDRGLSGLPAARFFDSQPPPWVFMNVSRWALRFDASLFLLSSESSQITGQTLVVDGGWSLVSPPPT